MTDSAPAAIGYWVVMDAPVATERIARHGYDYVCVDAQHGLLDHRGVVAALIAISAGGALAAAAGVPVPLGLVRVRENSPGVISQALDAGADGVIVPMVDTAADAAAAVAAVRYPPAGTRSYGPMRAVLRTGTDIERINDRLRVYAMIESAAGLANVAEIAATPGLSGLYIGPSDLTLAIGGRSSTDSAVAEEFARALDRIVAAARAAGVQVGIHTSGGQVASERVAAGFDLVTIACDLNHLDDAAGAHLALARGASR
ncbi:HpcH/HpaI aldolase family protein [Pseudactinotalea sp.]|uniref:HpcH/HpaI aldolase family protein n=1 Tax=Pseudactinotalea sp. TaxID=1926260 RepID=UPI003B3BACEE